MIDTTYSITTIPGSTPLAQRKPEPVERPAPGKEDAPNARKPSYPVQSEAAETLLRDHLQQSSSNFAAGAPQALRAKKAMNAYASLQNSAEREYVTKLLGVDERA